LFDYVTLFSREEKDLDLGEMESGSEVFRERLERVFFREMCVKKVRDVINRNIEYYWLIFIVRMSKIVLH
jgi:hypothetical protein